MLHASLCCDPRSEIDQFVFSQASAGRNPKFSNLIGLWRARDRASFLQYGSRVEFFLRGLNFASVNWNKYQTTIRNYKMTLKEKKIKQVASVIV